MVKTNFGGNDIKLELTVRLLLHSEQYLPHFVLISILLILLNGVYPCGDRSSSSSILSTLYWDGFWTLYPLSVC